jgi:predicted unusual protein kinase regulating ubiquinone biosynthesis (AarF/ABC1/UbiB family)
MTPDDEDHSGGEVPSSRLRRTAAIGRLAATEAAKYAGTYAANLGRTPDEAADALGRRQVEAARQIVRVLGSMKGVAMKAGQALSVVDLDAVPPAYRDEVRDTLAQLQHAAPSVSFGEIRRVIERELGEPLKDVFAEFDEEAVAAASIGQVYRARLHDGRDVAVKVQYPGIDAAVRADLQNLGPMLRVAKQIVPGLDVQATTDEIVERIHEELDYELEASNQRAVARAHRGHPFIVVPAVIGEWCRARVLVMEYVEGIGHGEIARLGQLERDRVAEMIFRFYFGSMYRHHQFSGDPHPGNSLLLADGRMAFLDFGLFKRISREAAEKELHIHRLGVEGRGEELVTAMAEAGMLPEPDRAEPERILAQFRKYTWWFTTDEQLELDPGLATRIIMDFSDPMQPEFHDVRRERLPAEHIFGRRLEMMTLAVMSQLRPRGNWYRIAREWLYDDEPATELGRLEAAYYAGRG